MRDKRHYKNQKYKTQVLREKIVCSLRRKSPHIFVNTKSAFSNNRSSFISCEKYFPPEEGDDVPSTLKIKHRSNEQTVEIEIF